MSDPFFSLLHFNNGSNSTDNGVPRIGQIENAPATRLSQPVLASREGASATGAHLASTGKRAASEPGIGPDNAKRARYESEDHHTEVPRLRESAMEDGSFTMQTWGTALAAVPPLIATSATATATTTTTITSTSITTLTSTMPNYAGSASASMPSTADTGNTSAVAGWPMPLAPGTQSGAQAWSIEMVNARLQAFTALVFEDEMGFEEMLDDDMMKALPGLLFQGKLILEGRPNYGPRKELAAFFSKIMLASEGKPDYESIIELALLLVQGILTLKEKPEDDPTKGLASLVVDGTLRLEDTLEDDGMTALGMLLASLECPILELY